MRRIMNYEPRLILLNFLYLLSVVKTTYIMPGFEILGPLQISFTRMLGDVTRFAVLFLLARFTLNSR